VDLVTIAQGTPGFSGADLENLVNESALIAARKDCKEVAMHHFELAKDKILMGPERKSMIMSLEEKRNTAYHEAGHAIVGVYIGGVDPVHKVSIIPRGQALGVTVMLPAEDRYTLTKEYAEGMIAYAMGGRAAEELMFHKQTTGAGDDINKATDIARKMVCNWGMTRWAHFRLGRTTTKSFWAVKSPIAAISLKRLLKTSTVKFTVWLLQAIKKQSISLRPIDNVLKISLSLY
jgi:cell division protease FtsH